MKLKYQLFITLLIASALLIALMLAVSSWSFNRGFLGYINNNEKVRVEPLVANLAGVYESEGNWDWTKASRRRWFDLINQTDLEIRTPELRELRELRKGPEPIIGPKQPTEPAIGSTRPPSPRITSPEQNERPDSTLIKRPPPPANAEWLILADAAKTPLLGNPSYGPKTDWFPIVSRGETVGYLGLIPRTRLNRKIDQVFAQQQKRSFGYAALGMILFSGLLSIVLGSRIVKPLLTVNTAVNEINQGNFTYRINSKRNDELGDLAQNINNLGFTLEQNLAARQRWIAEISHELRTPLAILQSEIEAIQDGFRTTNPESIDSLHAEVMRVNRLIDDLHQLSLSDIGGLEYKMQKLSLDESVTSYLHSHTSVIGSASLALQLNCTSALIVGDPQRICQLLDNLLQNTIRYTHTPGKLEVSVEIIATDAVLTWSDSSPGVTDHDHQHLFDPLYRSDESRNREHGGSGLGLAIVKKIVEAHSGTINCRHSDIGGLDIIVSIPLVKDRIS